MIALASILRSMHSHAGVSNDELHHAHCTIEVPRAGGGCSSVGSVTLWAVLVRQRQKEPATPGPMLEQGYLDLDTPAFSLRLVRSSQTVAALRPKGAGDFA